MTSYYSKSQLYAKIERVRNELLKISYNEYPLNLVDMCSNTTGIQIEMLDFKTHSLRGIAVLAENSSQDDIIMLNSTLSKNELNFYCGHEMVHLILHRNEQAKTFNCFDTVLSNQNPYMEWHANEGSAELLLPYRLLLPIVKSKYSSFTTWSSTRCFIDSIASKFCVTEHIVELRLHNLRYEIQQYLDGVPIDDICFLSNNQLEQNKIVVESLSNKGSRFLLDELEKNF